MTPPVAPKKMAKKAAKKPPGNVWMNYSNVVRV
jgi:hypothetical protein